MGFVAFCCRDTRKSSIDLYFYSWSLLFLRRLVYMRIPIQMLTSFRNIQHFHRLLGRHARQFEMRLGCNSQHRLCTHVMCMRNVSILLLNRMYPAILTMWMWPCSYTLSSTATTVHITLLTCSTLIMDFKYAFITSPCYIIIIVKGEMKHLFWYKKMLFPLHPWNACPWNN